MQETDRTEVARQLTNWLTLMIKHQESQDAIDFGIKLLRQVILPINPAEEGPLWLAFHSFEDAIRIGDSHLQCCQLEELELWLRNL